MKTARKLPIETAEEAASRLAALKERLAAHQRVRQALSAALSQVSMADRALIRVDLYLSFDELDGQREQVEEDIAQIERQEAGRHEAERVAERSRGG